MIHGNFLLKGTHCTLIPVGYLYGSSAGYCLISDVAFVGSLGSFVIPTHESLKTVIKVIIVQKYNDHSVSVQI